MHDKTSTSGYHDRVGGKFLQTRMTATLARHILLENIAQIRTVGEWAERAGCSPNWLGRCIKQLYGLLAREMLRSERYNRIVFVIRNNLEAYAAEVASLVAPHWNDKSLCDFLRRHYQTNFTTLRYMLLILFSSCAFVALMMVNVSVSMENTGMATDISLSGVTALAAASSGECDAIACVNDSPCLTFDLCTWREVCDDCSCLFSQVGSFTGSSRCGKLRRNY
jgi:AraC-like DNA-binding protein